MGEQFVLFATVWSLVVAPTLCRVGMLVQCCDDEAPWASAESVSSPADRCCGHEKGDPVKRPDERRECGACAALCSSVAKPSDHAETIVSAETFAVASRSDLASPTRLGMARAIERPSPQDRVQLPYPRSDIPRLI